LDSILIYGALKNSIPGVLLGLEREKFHLWNFPLRKVKTRFFTSFHGLIHGGASLHRTGTLKFSVVL